MTTPTHPGRMLFVNMPVADLARSKAFFAELGFNYDPTMTDENAACMLVGEHAFVMLLSREKFAEFSNRSFFDLDGHGWQVMWMDPAAAEQGPEAFAASMQDADAPA